jgi:hypothetical protein
MLDLIHLEQPGSGDEETSLHTLRRHVLIERLVRCWVSDASRYHISQGQKKDEVGITKTWVTPANDYEMVL